LSNSLIYHFSATINPYFRINFSAKGDDFG
jgi:hypothetical protein